jgi:hypothetical protein
MKTQTRYAGPHRNHVELRSRDYTPPRQCVVDDHSDKREPKPVREVNKMTATLAVMLGLQVRP